jgi:hypothetical protein
VQREREPLDHTLTFGDSVGARDERKASTRFSASMPVCLSFEMPSLARLGSACTAAVDLGVEMGMRPFFKYARGDPVDISFSGFLIDGVTGASGVCFGATRGGSAGDRGDGLRESLARSSSSISIRSSPDLADSRGPSGEGSTLRAGARGRATGESGDRGRACVGAAADRVRLDAGENADSGGDTGASLPCISSATSKGCARDRFFLVRFDGAS